MEAPDGVVVEEAVQAQGVGVVTDGDAGISGLAEIEDGDPNKQKSHMHLPPNVKKEAKKLLEKNGGYMPRDEDISMLTDSSGMCLVDGAEIHANTSSDRSCPGSVPMTEHQKRRTCILLLLLPPHV